MTADRYDASLRKVAADHRGDHFKLTRLPSLKVWIAPAMGWSQRIGRSSMTNQTNGWTGGLMWIGAVIGVLAVVLLVVVTTKLTKSSCAFTTLAEKRKTEP
jgi:hypothetical protein